MKSKTEKIRNIQADLVSRQNALNGKYKACQCGLSDDDVCREKDAVYLEGLRMKADLLDDLILNNEKEGNNTNNVDALKKLGEEINTAFHPIRLNELSGSIIGSYLAFMISYGVAFGIWCMVFKKGFWGFIICGGVLGALICSIFSLPVIMTRRSKERIKEAEIVLGYLWANLAIVIGIVGFITLAIRVMFFK